MANTGQHYVSPCYGLNQILYSRLWYSSAIQVTKSDVVGRVIDAKVNVGGHLYPKEVQLGSNPPILEDHSL